MDLTSIFGLSSLIAIGVAYFYGRYQGAKNAKLTLENQIRQETEKEFRRQVEVQDQALKEAEKRLQDFVLALNELKAKELKHEQESVQSPDSGDTALSSDRMQRLNDIR